jgi:CheY-like chemotaxis protein
MEEALRAGVDSFMANRCLPQTCWRSFERSCSARTSAEEQSRRRDLSGRASAGRDMQINAEIMRYPQPCAACWWTSRKRQRAWNCFEDSEIAITTRCSWTAHAVMDGLAAAAAIRALNREDAHRVPIIALTANAFDEDVQRSCRWARTRNWPSPEMEHCTTRLSSLIPANRTLKHAGKLASLRAFFMRLWLRVPMCALHPPICRGSTNARGCSPRRRPCPSGRGGPGTGEMMSTYSIRGRRAGICGGLQQILTMRISGSPRR